MSLVGSSLTYEASYANPRDESASENVVFTLGLRRSLNDNTNDEHGGGDDRSDASTNSISKPAVDEDANPGTEFENGREQTSLGCCRRSLRVERLQTIRERCHGQDLAKHALIISIDETSQRSKAGNGARLLRVYETLDASRPGELGSPGGQIDASTGWCHGCRRCRMSR